MFYPDFSKAFESVNRRLLLLKSEVFGISGRMLKGAGDLLKLKGLVWTQGRSLVESHWAQHSIES